MCAGWLLATRCGMAIDIKSICLSFPTNLFASHSNGQVKQLIRLRAVEARSVPFFSFLAKSGVKSESAARPAAFTVCLARHAAILCDRRVREKWKRKAAHP